MTTQVLSITSPKQLKKHPLIKIYTKCKKVKYFFKINTIIIFYK